MGLEPMTLRLKVWCSTDWASRAAHTNDETTDWTLFDAVHIIDITLTQKPLSVVDL